MEHRGGEHADNSKHSVCLKQQKKKKTSRGEKEKIGLNMGWQQVK